MRDEVHEAGVPERVFLRRLVRVSGEWVAGRQVKGVFFITPGEKVLNLFLAVQL